MEKAVVFVKIVSFKRFKIKVPVHRATHAQRGGSNQTKVHPAATV